MARELDNQLNQDVLEDYQNSDNLTMQERSHNLVEQDKDAEQSVKQPATEQILTDHVSVVKELSKRVDNTGQFFMVVRRTCNFTR